MVSLKKALITGALFCVCAGFALSAGEMQRGEGVRIERLPLSAENENNFKFIPAGCCYSPYQYEDYSPYPYDYFHNTYWW